MAIKTDALNYLLIPGNPPAVHFYELWKKEIEAAHPRSKVKVSVYPFFGHANPRDSQAVMDRVLEAHLDQLKIFFEDTQKPVTLIGHSLGAYFSLALLEKAADQVHEAVLVHPFLRIPTLRGRLILKSVGALHSQKKLHSVILKSRKALEFFSTDLSHVTNEEILKALHLARHEGKTIGRDRSPIHIEPQHQKKIRVFYTPRDSWCPAGTVRQFKALVKTTECSEPHDFITQKKYRNSIFKKILNI